MAQYTTNCKNTFIEIARGTNNFECIIQPIKEDKKTADYIYIGTIFLQSWTFKLENII